MLVALLHLHRRSIVIALPAAALVGCATGGVGGTPQPELAPAPGVLVVEMTPRELHEGQAAALVIRSQGADSIAFESENGIDRYWAHGGELRTTITADFGDAAPIARYAGEYRGQRLDLLRKRARIAVCSRGRCAEHTYDVPLRLPERNRRSVALTAGYSSVFARRSILGADRTVLFKEVLTSGVLTARGELASGGWNAQVQGFAGGGEHGGGVDVARMLKGDGEGLSYGIGAHVGMIRSEWWETGTGRGTGRTAWRAAVGPSVMLKGVTMSSLLGVYSDGTETLQISSTRISVNGNLTSVRHPLMITAEKTFAFGGGPIVSRRRDALERLTAGIRVLKDMAVSIGVSSHRIAWPEERAADDLRASETVITLGGQYSVSW